MMTVAGKRLIAAAKEALAIAKGEADRSSYEVHAPPPVVDVRAIRKRMNLTQQAFGLRFGFGAARVRDWEQGRTRPAASDRVLLVTIDRSPDVVLNALAEATARSRSSLSSDMQRRTNKRVSTSPTKRTVARKATKSASA